MSPPSKAVAATHGIEVRGGSAAAAAYLAWGLVPLYWKQLASINAVELIAQRHLWSSVFVLGLVAWQGRLGDVARAMRGRSLLRNLGSAVLLTSNWLMYVWGVNSGHVVEASLGYFLVPLVNVASARFVLHEALRKTQWLAVSLAALGVALLIWQLRRPPWIALEIAVTWGGYGLMRKQSPLGSVTGLAVETSLLAPFAAAWLLWRQHAGTGALGHLDAWHPALLLSAGIVTAVPLIWFAYGAKTVRLSTLGLLQYLAPTAQFALGVWVYHESFPRERLLCFGFIWAGLALYAFDGARSAGSSAAQVRGGTAIETA